MSIRTHVLQTLDDLSEAELERVAEMYAEFSAEDSILAEEGTPDYTAGLRQEDIQRR